MLYEQDIGFDFLYLFGKRKRYETSLLGNNNDILIQSLKQGMISAPLPCWSFSMDKKKVQAHTYVTKTMITHWQLFSIKFSNTSID